MIDVLAFGEILWDVIDGVPHIGGAPFNLAAHAAKCGLRAAIVSAVGRDDLGRRAVSEARRLGVATDFIAEHPMLPTGTVNVTLDAHGIPSYEIVRPVAWDEIGFSTSADINPRAFCFGTLAQRSPVSAATLSRLIASLPDSTLVFFDVNLRQDYWSRDLVERGLARTDILKVNDDEMRVLGLSPDALFARFPRLATVVETRGAQGCAVWWRTPGGASSPSEPQRTLGGASSPSEPRRTPGGASSPSEPQRRKPVRPACSPHLDCPALPDGPVVDTVGAGDAFSAAFLAAILRGESLEAAAEAGNRRAGQVAARTGAIPEGL